MPNAAFSVRQCRLTLQLVWLPTTESGDMTNDTLADWLARWTTSTSQTHVPRSAARKRDSFTSLRPTSRLAISTLLLAAASVPAAQAVGFECRFTTDGHEFDLNPVSVG